MLKPQQTKPFYMVYVLDLRDPVALDRNIALQIFRPACRVIDQRDLSAGQEIYFGRSREKVGLFIPDKEDILSEVQGVIGVTYLFREGTPSLFFKNIGRAVPVANFFDDQRYNSKSRKESLNNGQLVEIFPGESITFKGLEDDYSLFFTRYFNQNS